jgi:hypothetical protein
LAGGELSGASSSRILISQIDDDSTYFIAITSRKVKIDQVYDRAGRGLTSAEDVP